MEVYRKILLAGHQAVNWILVKKLAEMGELDELLQEGDQIPVVLKNGDKILLDFTHDQNGKAYFVFHDCYGKHQMNKTNTNKGGWRDCEMRKYVTEKILPLLPADLAAVIAPTKIRQIRNGEELISEDKLFLLSNTQVFGGNWDNEPDDTQLEIFKRGTNRVKGDTEGDASLWWLRSANGTGYFYRVSSDGYNDYIGASNTGGVDLGFCLD